jgi:hypothetical protein
MEPQTQPLTGGTPSVSKTPAPPHNLHPISNYWFATSVLFFFSAICGFFRTLFSGELVNAVEFFYLSGMASLCALYKAPSKLTWIMQRQAQISKYFNALTRLSFFGVFLIFLGCSLVSANQANIGHLGFLIYAYIAAIIGICVGIFTTVMGYNETQKLNRLRIAIRTDDHQKNKAEGFFEKYARDGVLRQPDFKRMAVELRGVDYTQQGLLMIFSALSSDDSKEFLNKEDFVGWANSDFPTLV